jgi:hypothetical protein
MARKIDQRRDAAHISFRITNPAVVEELAAKAEASGSSPNLIARELVTEGLTRPNEIVAALDQLCAKVDGLAAKVRQLDIIQQTLERSVYLLLKHGGQLDSAQARKTMERYFASGAAPPELDHALHQENGPRE